MKQVTYTRSSCFLDAKCYLTLIVSPVSITPLPEKKNNLHSFGGEKMHLVPLPMSYSQHLLDKISAQLLKADLSPFALFSHVMWSRLIFEQSKFCLVRHKDQSSDDMAWSRNNKTLKSKRLTKSMFKFKITFLVLLSWTLNPSYRPFLLYWCLKHHGQSTEVALSGIKRC